MPSFDRPRETVLPPSPWVRRFTTLVRPGGTVLDVAAGHGRHARWFLECQFRVVAVDVEVSGLGDLADHPRAEVLALDLETGAEILPGRQFDAIVVTNYLHRPHFPWLASALAPGGVLIMEAFGAGNEAFGRPRNPAFLLEPGELLAWFGTRLQVVAYEHGREETPRPAVRQRLCARRPAGDGSVPFLPPAR